MLPGPSGVRLSIGIKHSLVIAGSDFLVLAETWIKGGTEPEWRSAVSFHEPFDTSAHVNTTRISGYVPSSNALAAFRGPFTTDLPFLHPAVVT